MSKAWSKARLGRYGVWSHKDVLTPQRAKSLEALGFGTAWLGGLPAIEPELNHVEALLEATETLSIATGIVNVWSADAATLAKSFHRLEANHPGRFVLGIGVGHPEFADDYRSPFQVLTDYLDVLDAEGVAKERRVLAALGPRVLRLAAERAGGVHPYLVTPAHTERAREILGPDAILAPEQFIVLDDDLVRAREAGREALGVYLTLVNYLANLRRLGFDDEDLAAPGSDRLVDALVAHGDGSAIAAHLEGHVEAGADHVAIQLLHPEGADLDERYEALARAVIGGQ